VNPERGLLDTSVAVDLESIDQARLPAASAISSLTLAELAAGPHAATEDAERARRQQHLQFIEASIESLEFDSSCARAYGRIASALIARGRKVRGARSVDLMIAATALAHDLSLYTLNADDLRGLDGLVEIVDLAA